MRARFASFIAVVALLLLGSAQTASATFHEMMIREVYAGSAAHPGSEYVELQMWAPGQNFVGGHTIGFYGPSGALAGTATFAHDVNGDANQSTLVAATPEAEAEFGIEADAALSPGLLNPAGGAVCWESLDCVAWGGFSGSAKSPTGPPVAAGGIPDGMALRRTIEPGCATLLEPGDDRDSSAADFSAVFPAPRPNSVAPSEHACAPSGAIGGGSHPGGDATGTTGHERPLTTIRQGPGHRTRDRTPTFRFTSSLPGSTYLCRLDSGGFKGCRSPFTAHRLGLGRHTFEVEARAPDGATDRSQATYRFKIAKPRQARPPG
jgi:hypothetical protein